MAHATVNGLSIYYRDTGGDNFPLVLAHGFTGNSRNWALTAPALRDRFRLISVDHRGHGLSDKPTAREDYDLDLLADDLYQLLRGIGVENCYLAGHSMGGMVAQLLTLQHPELVRALVLVDTAAELPRSLAAKERYKERQKLATMAEEQGMEAVFEEHLKAAGQQVRANPLFVQTWREQFLMTSPHAYVGGAHGMSTRRPVVDRLSEIKVPTLVVCGENDEPFLDASQVMHENIPGSELVVIAGAGHNPQIEAPAEFNRVLAGFLDRVHSEAMVVPTPPPVRLRAGPPRHLMAYDIEAVREKYIGFETAKARGRYPVEHDPIRRHCHMVEDNNPLFIDPEYAATTEHGVCLAPPSGWLALLFASLGPWPAVFEPLFLVVPTPGKRLVNMSQETEWFARIRVGDHLSVVRRVADVYQKGITIDPEAVWIVAEAIITNQREEKVCVIRNTLLTHRTPEEVREELGTGNKEHGGGSRK